MNWFLIGVLLLPLVTGCQSPRRGTPKEAPKSSASIDDDNAITKEALRDAAAVIATGKLYVCDAGTIAPYTPGIDVGTAALVRDLPHRLLPSGCTEPKALRSVAYAKVFNGQIVRFLMAPTSQPKSAH